LIKKITLLKFVSFGLGLKHQVSHFYSNITSPLFHV
jgi:hypothetical protein